MLLGRTATHSARYSLASCEPGRACSSLPSKPIEPLHHSLASASRGARRTSVIVVDGASRRRAAPRSQKVGWPRYAKGCSWRVARGACSNEGGVRYAASRDAPKSSVPTSEEHACQTGRSEATCNGIGPASRGCLPAPRGPMAVACASPPTLGLTSDPRSPHRHDASHGGLPATPVMPLVRCKARSLARWPTSAQGSSRSLKLLSRSAWPLRQGALLRSANSASCTTRALGASRVTLMRSRGSSVRPRTAIFSPRSTSDRCSRTVCQSHKAIRARPTGTNWQLSRGTVVLSF